ncbi:hypothetical protein W911_09725 [Hyphomicrobium nitrativorans NL23]|uniref:Isoprenylcysteine carboxyl methyltransferase n=2 Tax=Hyphomicrobium TaxID=81 RepID=V5SDP1_9HYPH|nr:hypothetical protein W911_09725 [Hyphomicrobium nitrativorans NL23]
MTQPNASPTLLPRIPWPPILLVSVIAGAIGLGEALPLSWPGVDDTPTRLVGSAFGLMGAALFVWSVWTLHRHETTVRPDRPARVLVTDGPFRFRRNPIYLAHLLILLGVAELTKNVWFAILVIPYAVLVTWLAIGPEERHLEDRFGDAYRDYKERTRRLL